MRLLDETGELIGVVKKEEALRIAQEKGIDLVEISPTADPPVCKTIDYGKMLYALKKKDQQTKRKTKANETKGVRLTFRIGPGDLERQRAMAEKFLSTGHPIRIQLIMKGREKAHKDLAYDKMNAFIESLAEFGTADDRAKGSGHQIVAMMRPDRKKEASEDKKD